MLLGTRQRGLTRPPKLAVGDGAMAFWSALSEVWPETCQLRCWMHKAGNVLNCLPKSAQAKAKQGLHETWMAETRAAAERAFDDFLERYEGKYLKATDLPGAGPRRTARLLRLPGGALDAHPHHQRDRVGLRHDRTPELAGEGLRHPTEHALDDLQEGHERGEVVASTTRLPAACQGHRGRDIQRRPRGRRGQKSRRMTDSLYTVFDNGSLVRYGTVPEILLPFTG